MCPISQETSEVLNMRRLIHFFLSVVALAGTELIFFAEPHAMLCFRFLIKIVVIKHCWF